jgi:7-cyano-7-deazaguanine synthase
MTKNRDLAVVLCSGGLDSCVTAAIAARSHELAMLHVSYGQRTQAREYKAFQDICRSLAVAHQLKLSMNHLAVIGGSSLTNQDIPVPVDGLVDSTIPNTYVPFRNANLLSAAVSWGETLGATAVFIGVNEIDSSGYPDCSREFIDRFNAVIAAGTRPTTHLRIETPLLNLSKPDIVKLGIDSDAPLDKSWSCYKEDLMACGCCDSCRLRLKGFQELGMTDPIPYKTNDVNL